MGKISKYDALQWTKSIVEHGFNKFCLDHLPMHLKDKRILMRAKQEEYVYKIGMEKVRYTGNEVTLWEVHPDIMNVDRIVNTKMRKIT